MDDVHGLVSVHTLACALVCTRLRDFVLLLLLCCCMPCQINDIILSMQGGSVSPIRSSHAFYLSTTQLDHVPAAGRNGARIPVLRACLPVLIARLMRLPLQSRSNFCDRQAHGTGSTRSCCGKGGGKQPSLHPEPHECVQA